MEPWELTDEEIEDIFQEAVVDEDVMKDYRAIATAAGQKARKDLAEGLMREVVTPYCSEKAEQLIAYWLKGQL